MLTDPASTFARNLASMLRRRGRAISVFATLAASIATSAQTALDIPAADPTIAAVTDAARHAAIAATIPGTDLGRIVFVVESIVVHSTDGTWGTTFDGTRLQPPLIQAALTPITARFQGSTVTGAVSNQVVISVSTGTDRNIRVTDNVPTDFRTSSGCSLNDLYGDSERRGDRF